MEKLELEQRGRDVRVRIPVIDWLNRTGSKIFASLSAVGLLAGPELEAISAEGFFTRWHELERFALFLVAPWFRPVLWALLIFFGIRWAIQWADKRYSHRGALDAQIAARVGAAETRVESRARGIDERAGDERRVVSALATLRYVDHHWSVFAGLMKSYDEQWEMIEQYINEPQRFAGLQSALISSWQDQVRRLKNTKAKIEQRAQKTFAFRAVNINDDAINRREPPEARDAPEEVRRAYRELWREDQHHREWLRQFSESIDARRREAHNIVETSVTGMPPQSYMGLEGGPPKLVHYDHTVEVHTKTPPVSGVS